MRRYDDDYGLPSRRGEGERICGKCVWHRKDCDKTTDAWVCRNPESDLYLDITDYRCKCPDFEERD